MPAEHTHCSICDRSLTDLERLGPATTDDGTICGACKRELEFAERRAARTPAEAEAEDRHADIVRVQRENAKLLARFVDMQDDIGTIRTWVVFMGVVTLLGVIVTVLALFGACLRIIG